MTSKVRKAVFPVAGLGTRLLPATKTIPKEMITIVDRPLIQYAVDEAREAGIEQMVFVTGRGKSTLVDYFDTAFELEATLRDKGKSLDALSPSRARVGEIVSVRQQQPLGLGHAVWCAREIVGDEPFAVILPDDLMVPGALKQMVGVWEKLGGNLVATEEVPAEKTGSYGIITPGESAGDLTEVLGLVEKPAPGEAPSRLGVIGRYLLQPEVFDVLDKRETGAGREIQLTDAMARLIGEQPFHALKVDAVRYDCGDRIGFVLANLALALEREDVGPKLREELKRL
ncbi:MAG: UTP--glucose-1-phosphate uridylyltransferase [Sphingomicrobium sp.]